MPSDDSLIALQAEYAALRQQLETVLAQPEKDKPQADALVQQLEQLQLRFKGLQGIVGNNPNE